MGRKNRKRTRPVRSEADEPESVVAGRHRPDELPPNWRGPPGSAAGDVHAAGNVEGGTAVGGMAGTNVGDGSPENADFDAAAGSGNFDIANDSDQEDAYAGHSGGAVGGTPANQRTRGGRTSHG